MTTMKTITIIALLITTACAGVRFGPGPLPQTEHFKTTLAACRGAADAMAQYNVMQNRSIKLHCMEQFGYVWRHAQYITTPARRMTQEIPAAVVE